MRGKIIAYFCDRIKRLHVKTALHHYSSTSLHQWTNSYWAFGWCLCASRWQEALDAGCAPKVELEATDEKALQTIKMKDLISHAKKQDV